MSQHHEWGWMVVVYLYFGGLGAGSVMLSGLAHLTKREHFRGIARTGAIVAPIFVGLGCALLLFDLGRPWQFWRLFTHINPVSPMSLGSWFLVIFSVISMVYALFYMPPSWARFFAKFPIISGIFKKFEAWNEPSAEKDEQGNWVKGLIDNPFPNSPNWVSSTRNFLAFIMIPLGVAVGIYTGILLGAIPARPFWNTPMVAQLFLFSALSASTGLLFLLVPLLWKGSDRHVHREHRVLLTADLIFIIVEFFIILPFIIHAQLSTHSTRVAMEMILGGPYTQIFWIGVVLLGILIPMVLEFGDFFGWFKVLPKSMAKFLHLAVAILILIGGYLLRWVFVHAGQDTHFL